MNNSVVSNVT